MHQLALIPISGGMSSAIAATITMPLDVIKTRFQTQPGSFMHIFRQLVAERGYR